MEDQDRYSEPIEKLPNERSLSDFDEAAYLPMLDGLDIALDQKRECLRILWNIARMCIEMNIPAETWGQIARSIIEHDPADSPGIDSKYSNGDGTTTR